MMCSYIHTYAAHTAWHQNYSLHPSNERLQCYCSSAALEIIPYNVQHNTMICFRGHIHSTESWLIPQSTVVYNTFSLQIIETSEYKTLFWFLPYKFLFMMSVTRLNKH